MDLNEAEKYLLGHVVRNGDHAWMEMDGAIRAAFKELRK